MLSNWVKGSFVGLVYRDGLARVGHTSLLHGHGVGQHRTCELLGPHGLCEQKALRQSETHLAHGKKVRRGLHALCDSTYDVPIRKLESPTAYRLLQWFISAASDKFAINFKLNERE